MSTLKPKDLRNFNVSSQIEKKDGEGNGWNKEGKWFQNTRKEK